jgi:hypothetical protein
MTMLFIGINVEIMKLSADILSEKRYLQYTQWVTYGRPMQRSVVIVIGYNKTNNRYIYFFMSIKSADENLASIGVLRVIWGKYNLFALIHFISSIRHIEKFGEIYQ